MSRPDSTASAALGAEVVKPVWFAFLDFLGDPVRANSSGADITLTGTGDPDLDGHLFIGISHAFIDITPVSSRQGGSDTVTARLSGIPGLDDETLVQIGNRANWQGRPIRLWRIIRNAQKVQQGAINPYHTGYMTACSIEAEFDDSRPGEQAISIASESYLVAFNQASNRSYMDQDRYDPGDLSARRATSIANGNTGNPITGGTPVGGQNYGDGGRTDSRDWIYL